MGRVQLQASDQVASLEVGFAYPSVAVCFSTATGVVWVGYSFSGAQQYPGVGGAGLVLVYWVTGLLLGDG